MSEIKASQSTIPGSVPKTQLPPPPDDFGWHLNKKTDRWELLPLAVLAQAERGEITLN